MHRIAKLIGTLVAIALVMTAWYFIGTAEQRGDATTEFNAVFTAIVIFPLFACILGWIVAGLINMIVSWVRY